MVYTIRPGHKISGVLATKAIVGGLDPKASGKSFFGKIPPRAFNALKKDPKIASHLSRVQRGFKSEVPEDIVHYAQKKLAGEGFVKYEVRKDSYKQSQGLLGNLREAEKMPQKDALKFLELGKEGFDKWQQNRTTLKKPKEIDKFLKLAQGYKNIDKEKSETYARKATAFELPWLRKTNPKEYKIRSREELARRISEDQKEPGNAAPFLTVSRQDNQKNEQKSPTDPLGPDTDQAA